MKDEIKEQDPFVEPQKTNQQKRNLKKRLKEYALRIIRLYESLPKHGAVHVVSH